CTVLSIAPPSSTLFPYTTLFRSERRVLLGVEQLEHRARGVAPEVGAQLVDLVDQEDRVLRLRVAQRPQDRAGHRADVGAAVTARSEEHTSELQSRVDLVCRLPLE